MWLRTINKNEPLLVITFDDGLITNYTKAFPMMTSRGIKGTSYLINYYYDVLHLTNYMNFEQITEMINAGWDMQCHTYSHPYMGETSPQNAYQQLVKNNDVMKKENLPLFKHIATPFGSWDYRNIRLFKQRRKSHRATQITKLSLEKLENIDIYEIGAYYGDIESEIKLETFKGYIDSAIQNGTILVVYWHVINEAREQLFEEFLDYVVSSGIKTITHSELYERFKLKNYNHEFL